jgi:hypothetical protein
VSGRVSEGVAEACSVLPGVEIPLKVGSRSGRASVSSSREARWPSTRDETGPEARVDARVDLEVPVTGQRRQVVRVGRAEHDLRLGLAEGAQTEPVREVRVEAAELATLDALARQQQVHTNRPADAPDLQEQVDEVGLRREQLAELVDDDEQVRHGSHLGTLGTELPVVRDGRGGPGLLEHPLAPDDLALDRRAGARGELRVVGEVVDQPGEVREPREGREGRTTLVVDEDHREVFGRVRQREGQDQRAEHLGLARARGADADAVRAHAQLRTLLEVEAHGVAVVVGREGHVEELRGRPGTPERLGVDVVEAVDAEQLVDVEGPVALLVLGGREREAHGGHRAGCRLEERHTGLVRLEADVEGVGGPRGGGERPGHGPVERDPHVELARLVEPVREQVHDRHAELLEGRAGADRQGRGATAVVVDDHEETGRLAAHRPCPLRGVGVLEPVGQRAAEHVREAREVGRDPAGRDRSVEQLGVLDVREQVEPLPVGAAVWCVGRGDREVVGPVLRGELEQHAADRRDGVRAVAHHGHDSDVP